MDKQYISEMLNNWEVEDLYEESMSIAKKVYILRKKLRQITPSQPTPELWAKKRIIEIYRGVNDWIDVLERLIVTCETLEDSLKTAINDSILSINVAKVASDLTLNEIFEKFEEVKPAYYLVKAASSYNIIKNRVGLFTDHSKKSNVVRMEDENVNNLVEDVLDDLNVVVVFSRKTAILLKLFKRKLRDLIRSNRIFVPGVAAVR